MKVLNFNIPHRKLYIYFLFLLVFGVSLSKPLMSVSVIGLTINWLFEGGFRTKLKKNKSIYYAPLILSSAFLIEFLWLTKTEVFSDGLLDLKTKLPMFFLPLIIGTSKNLSKQLHISSSTFATFYLPYILFCMKNDFLELELDDTYDELIEKEIELL